MIGSLPNPRYERKFIAESFTLAEALALVRRHRCAFREAYSPRTVNNIYLDSPSRSAYYDHINGASHRVKHRVRWYGSLEQDIRQPVLERKFKSGSVSGKDTHLLSALQLNRQPLKTALVSTFASLPKQLQEDLRLLEPCLLNQYRRYYFVSADGRFRLTVDSDFRFGQAHRSPAKVRPARGLPSVVLEVKFELQHATCAQWITDTFPFRIARCSKFILGTEGL
jgi:SPX domain protein involved in polyphosphate accumulation